MKAIVCQDFGESSVEEIPRPEPAENEVLLEVVRIQLSVTECQLFMGEELHKYKRVREKIHNGDGRLFGHELGGRVVETGKRVDGLEVGDRVYAPGKITCSTCDYCKAGYPEFCRNPDSIGFYKTGGLAEYIAVPPEPLCKLPEEVSDLEAAALQPYEASLHYVIESVAPGDKVVLMGTGVMGYGCGQFAMQAGADRVIAIDVVPQKLDLASQKGMIPVDARRSDPVEQVRELTDGMGADVVFEAVGGDQNHVTDGEDPLAQAFTMVRQGGTIGQVGLITGEMAVNPSTFRNKRVNWTSPIIHNYSLTPGVTIGDLTASMVASDRISVDEYVTHELRGLESFAQAVDITLNKEEYDALGPAQLVLSD